MNEFIKFRNRKIRIALYCNNPRCSVVGWFLYLKKNINSQPFVYNLFREKQASEFGHWTKQAKICRFRKNKVGCLLPHAMFLKHFNWRTIRQAMADNYDSCADSPSSRLDRSTSIKTTVRPTCWQTYIPTCCHTAAKRWCQHFAGNCSAMTM